MGIIVANNKDLLEAQRRVIEGRDLKKQNTVNKANEETNNKKGSVTHS